jgi:hypothetical protein
MVQDIIWKADSQSACQKYPFFMEPEGSFHKSPPLDPILNQKISPGPKRFETFRKNNFFTVRSC